MKPQEYTNWLSDGEYQSLLGHYRRGVSLTLQTLFGRYGQQDEIKIATAIIIYLGEEYGMALRGKPKPPEIPDWFKRTIESYNADD